MDTPSDWRVGLIRLVLLSTSILIGCGGFVLFLRYGAADGLDLMDVLAGYNNRAFAPLDQIASLLGFPGKMGMSGGKVFDQFQAGNLKGIRDYCETDVLNTWLVYLRFQMMRGQLDRTGYEQELALLRDYLKQENQPHFNEFLDAWGA